MSTLFTVIAFDELAQRHFQPEPAFVLLELVQRRFQSEPAFVLPPASSAVKLLESESRLVSHDQSRPCPLVSHYTLYNGLDCILGSRPTHIRLYAPADRRRIDMRPNPIWRTRSIAYVYLF